MADLTVTQVADRLLISGSAVRAKIKAGDLVAYRVATGDYRITPTELARYTEAQKTRPHGMTRFWEGVRELRRQAAAGAA